MIKFLIRNILTVFLSTKSYFFRKNSKNYIFGNFLFSVDSKTLFIFLNNIFPQFYAIFKMIFSFNNNDLNYYQYENLSELIMTIKII